MTGSPFYANDSSRGVSTYFAGLNMYVVFTMFNGSNPFARNLNTTLVDVYNKYMADPKMIKNAWDTNPYLRTNFNGVSKYTE
jgi:hypothetical protein